MWEDAFPSADRRHLRRRLLARPQLLGVSVESTIPGLFEMAVLAGIDRSGWADWSYKCLPLALMRPETFRLRLQRVLTLLNDGPCAAEAAPAPAALAAAGGGRHQGAAPQGAGGGGGPPLSLQPLSAAGGAGLGVGQPDGGAVRLAGAPSAAVQAVATGFVARRKGRPPSRRTSTARAASEAVAAPPVGGAVLALFTLVDVQKAAQRDHRWLLIREEALVERLASLQRDIGVPWALAARAFLRLPSLLTRRPELIRERVERFMGLEGLGADRAREALCSLPSLLVLSPEVVAERWGLLQQAAESHEPWRGQLSYIAPSTLASLLVRSQARLERLLFLAETGQQGEGGAVKTVVNASEAVFKQRFPGYQSWQEGR